MKKTVFILLTMLMFIFDAKADMVENGGWQEEKIEGDKVEIQYKYRFYKDIKKGEYLDVGQDSIYQYEDKGDVIYGNYSEYQSVCDEVPGYEIDYKKEYVYKKILPIQYIKIFNTSDELLSIKNIKMYNLDKKLSYNIAGFVNYDSNEKLIYPNGSITYYINASVSLKDIKVELEFYNENTDYELLFGSYQTFNNSTIVSKVDANTNEKIYKYSDNFLIYENYSDSLYSGDFVEEDFVKVISEKTFCRFRNIKTFHYNIEKEYYDNNYYVNVDELINLSTEEKSNYKKDESDYKIFYRLVNNNDESLLENEVNIDNNIEENEIDDKISYTELHKLENSEIKLVKTGIEKQYNYKYLIIYVLCLLLLGVILIKRIKKNVD